MKKKIYQQPTLKSFSLRVERGFQASQVPQTKVFGFAPQGTMGYTMDDHNQNFTTDNNTFIHTF